MALEHIRFAEGGEEYVLNHFLSIGSIAAEYPQRNIIQFTRIEVKNALQRVVIAGLEAIDQAGIRFGAHGASRRRVRANFTTLWRRPGQWCCGSGGRDGKVGFARHKGLLVCRDRHGKISLIHSANFSLAIVSSRVAMKGEQLIMRSFSLLMPI